MMYYLKKQEVKIGEKVKINDISITLTQQIVDDNPELFEAKDDFPKYVECISNKNSILEEGTSNIGQIYKVKGISEYRNDHYYFYGFTYTAKMSRFKPSTKEAYEEQELLAKDQKLIKETKLRYPIGCKVNQKTSYGNGGIYTIKNDNVKILHYLTGTNISIGDVGVYNGVDGKWAEIVEPLFVSEDGVNIYEGDDSFLVCKIGFTIYKSTNAKGNGALTVYFSTKEAAQQWVDENKPKEKTLEDYENILLKDKGYRVLNGVLLYNQNFYAHLKLRESKLYYSKVLQLIADDLNGYWTSEIKNSGFFMYFDGDSYDVKEHKSVKYDMIYFKSNKLAYKAIKIMGDKLDYIFK